LIKRVFNHPWREREGGEREKEREGDREKERESAFYVQIGNIQKGSLKVVPKGWSILYTCLQVLNRFGPYGGIEPRTFL
jgi:hypothetical protein